MQTKATHNSSLRPTPVSIAPCQSPTTKCALNLCSVYSRLAKSSNLSLSSMAGPKEELVRGPDVPKEIMRSEWPFQVRPSLRVRV